MSPVSEAQKRATMKYMAKAYDRIELKVPKGKKEVIQDCASAIGESLNGFVNTAIDERMERMSPDFGGETATQEGSA